MNESWRDAFDAQVDMSHWYETEAGAGFLLGAFAAEASDMTQESSIALLRASYRSEHERLSAAVPFFVSRDMCELVDHASESFQPEPIYPTDFLQMQGFVYYERPFRIPDRYGRTISLKAIAWQPVMDGRDLVEDHRFLSRDDEMREWLEERHDKGMIDGLIITLYEQTGEWAEENGPKPPLVPIHMTPWWWGMSFEGNEITLEGRPSGAEWWWKIVQTTLRLMQQQITMRHPETPYRQRRKEGIRYGVPPNDTVVVTLRRERGEQQEPSGDEAHYTHRFMVGGHWRWQNYKDGIRRQIYIAPFIKGPEDKPLIIKPRAYAWLR